MNGLARMVLLGLCGWGLLQGGAVAAEPGGSALPIEAFTQSPPISSPRLSPDGQYVAANAAYDDGNYAVLVYRTADMKPVSMLRLPRYELAVQIAWVSGRRLVIGKGRKVGSLEKPWPTGEIIATDLDGSRQTYIYGYQQTGRVVGLSRGFGYIAGLPPMPNGRFYMRQYSPDSHHSMLYDIDAESGSSRLVADVPVPDLDFVLDAQGTPRYAYGTDENDDNQLFSVDDRGVWKPMPQVQASWIPVALSRDGKRAFGYYGQGGPVALVSSGLDGQDRTVIASDPFYSMDDLQWSNRPAVPFAVGASSGGSQARYLADGEETQLHQALRAGLPGRQIEFVDYSTDGSHVLMRISSDHDAGGWYLYERAANKLHRLLLVRPELPPERLGERRLVRFQARDGMTLDAVLTFPPGRQPGGAPLPMVLLPHGGPHAPGDRWAFDSDAQFLASRGYLVLQVNYRGSQGRGNDFEKAGYRQWGDAVQNDLLDGVHWTIDQGMAERGRICAYGASFGAYAAMMVTVREPGLFRCAAGLAGIYDLKMMYAKGDIRQSEYGRNYLVRAIGSDDAVLARNSPVNLAGQIHVPVLLAHGEQDQRAPFAQARAMRAALEKAGNAPEWMAVPREGHGFYKDQNNVEFYRRLEAFLARNLAATSQAALPPVTAEAAKMP